MQVEIIPTTLAHLRELAETMREADKEEVMGFGISPAKALNVSYKGAVTRKTALIEGKVAACWGCGGIFMGDTGQPWLLTSNEVYKVSSFRFARIYQNEVVEMLNYFSRLENFVDSEYSSAIKLLKISGFTIGDPEPIGMNGKLFRKFTLEI